MKHQNSLGRVNNSYITLLSAAIAGLAASLTHYLSMKYLYHIGLGATRGDITHNPDYPLPGVDLLLASIWAFLQLPLIFYTFIVFCIIFSIIVGLLVLRILKTEHSGKITFVVSLILITILTANLMLNVWPVLPPDILTPFFIYPTVYIASTLVVMLFTSERFGRKNFDQSRKQMIGKAQNTEQARTLKDTHK